MLIIGIPKKGDDESFNAMIDSLLKSTNAYDEIVVATPEDVTDLLLNNNARVIHLIKKDFKSPLEAYNALFEYAKEKKADLLITQTDVIFPTKYKADWLTEMMTLAKNPICGAVTCLGGYKYSGPDYVDGFPWLGGWCTYFPYRTIKQIGAYDESFPNGYGVDIDHSYAIHKAGLKVFLTDYWVHHHMQNERLHDNDPNTEQMKKESAEYFRKKWKLQS